MALDTVTTSLVGLCIGAVGVSIRASAFYVDGGLRRSPQQSQMVLFFAFLTGFLFAWGWTFASPVLVPAAALPGALVGSLWGAFAWASFTLPAELAHLTWGRQTAEESALGLGCWLVQFTVGGAICGSLLVP